MIGSTSIIDNRMSMIFRTATAAHKRFQPHGTADSDCQSTCASIRVSSGDSRAAYRRTGSHPGTTSRCQPEGGLRRRGRHRDDGGWPGDASQREPSESSLGLKLRDEQPQRTKYVAAVLESSPRNGEFQPEKLEDLSGSLRLSTDL